MFCTIMTLILLNNTQWQFSDLKHIKNAGKRCYQLHGTCLKSFTKVKSREYRAICK